MIRLNRSFYMHTIGLCMIPILFVLILSFSVFLMINASVTSILIIISLPFIETITIILASLIANKDSGGSNMGSVLSVKELSIKLKDRVLTDKISFCINSGDAILLSGENGIGKSSIL